MIPAREHRATAVETALADLERALCRDRCHVVVCASTGPAKALLLGALAERVAGALRVIPLPPPDPGDELCAPILRELGEACGEDAEASLVAVVRRLASQGSALALVAGEARALPEPLLRRLGRLCALAKPGLRLVLVADAGEGRDAVGAFMAPLGIGAVKVSLDRPPQRAASGERPAPCTPPRVVAHGDAMRARGIRVISRRARVGRPARLALVGVAVAALGFLAADRTLPVRREVAPPRAQAARVPKRAPQPVSTPAPAPAPISAPAPIAAEATAPVERAPVALAVASPQVERAPVTPIDVAAADPVNEPVALGAPPEPAAPAEAPAPDAPAGPLASDTPAGPLASDAPAGPLASDAPAGPLASDAPPESPASEAPPLSDPPPVRTIRVSLNADPWAHIAIDGRDVGVTPMADLELSEGLHRFRARFPDGRVMERTLRVDPVRDHLSFP